MIGFVGICFGFVLIFRAQARWVPHGVNCARLHRASADGRVTRPQIKRMGIRIDPTRGTNCDIIASLYSPPQYSPEFVWYKDDRGLISSS